MASPTDTLSVYRELAEHYDRLGQPAMRDRFLILAADAALQARHPALAEQLRQRLLHGSRQHLLRPYASFAEAAAAPDVQSYLRDLRVNYPPEIAREMLAELQQPARAGNGAIPPTAPVMDLYAPGQWQGAGAVEPYPLAEEINPAPTRPRAAPPPRQAPRPAPLPVAEPLVRPGPVRPRAPADGGGWVGAAIAAVVLLAALAAAAFTLARPFLP